VRIVALLVCGLFLPALMAPHLARPAAGACATGRAVADRVQQADDSLCTVEASKAAGPLEVRLGEAVAITLTISASCPPPPPPRLVFVSEVTGTVLDWGTAQAFFRAIARALPPGTGVGLVMFDAAGGEVCPIRYDPTAEGECVEARPAMTLADAVREALALFELARAGGDHLYEGLVAATDAGTLDCQAVLDAAAEARHEKIELRTLCIGPGCPGDCLRQVATTPRHYYEAATLDDLPDTGRALLGDLTGAMVERAATPLHFEFTDNLPPNMAYRRGTARPDPSRTSPMRDSFTWAIDAPPDHAVTASLVVEPLDVGTFPTNLGATGLLTDRIGRTRSFAFPPPSVRVLAAPPRRLSVYVPVAEVRRR
jgi:hypothetical protein